MEVLIHLTHLSLLVPLQRLANDFFIECLLVDDIFRLHHLDESLWVHVWPNDLNGLFKVWMFLVVWHCCIDSYHILHLSVVIVHEVSHLVDRWVIPLLSHGFFVLEQLTRKVFSFLLLCLQGFKQGYLIVRLAPFLFLNASVMDLVREDEPDVVLIVTNKLSDHPEDFDLAHLLQKLCHLVTLNFSVLLKLAINEQLEFVYVLIARVVDEHRVFVQNVFRVTLKWSFEFNSYVVRLVRLRRKRLVCLRGLGSIDTRLKVVDNFGHRCVCVSQVVSKLVVAFIVICDRYQILKHTRVLIGHGTDWLRITIWVATIPTVLKVVVVAHPNEPLVNITATITIPSLTGNKLVFSTHFFSILAKQLALHNFLFPFASRG